MTRRSVWTLIVVLLCVAGITFFVLSRRKGETVKPSEPTVSTQPVIPPKSAEELRKEWTDGVNAALAKYDQDQNAKTAMDSLLALTVPSADRGVHLKLVLAFQALVNGDKNAKDLLVKARKGL